MSFLWRAHFAPSLNPRNGGVSNRKVRREKVKKSSMASLTMAFAPAVFAAKTTKGTGEVKAEKGGFLDWFLEGLAKESLVEVDPLLKKVEEKNGGGGSSSKKKTVSVAAPPKKNGGGFGGLFAKK